MNNLFTTLVYLLLFSIISSSIYGQVTNVKYQLTYNNDSCFYDAYLIIDQGEAFDPDDRIQFNAQYSIVTSPETYISINHNYMPLLGNEQYDGTLPMEWNLNTDFQDYPSVNTINRFYQIVPNLGMDARFNDLYPGDTIKLFSLVVDSFMIDQDIRLWDNNIDPYSSDPNMEGRDFDQGYTIGSSNQLYTGNAPSTKYQGPTLVDASDASVIDLDIEFTNQCTAPYTFLWTGPAGFSSTSQQIVIQDPQFSNDGEYCCIVTDGAGDMDTLCINVCNIGCKVIIDTTFCSPGLLTLDTGIDGSTWTGSITNSTPTSVNSIGNGLIEISYDNLAAGLYTYYYNEVDTLKIIKVQITQRPQTSILDTIICVLGSTIVSPSTSVSWTSDSPLVAVVTNTGIVTGLSPGKARLLATSYNGLCISDSLLEVSVLPAIQIAYAGPNRICEGDSTNVSSDVDGVWTSSDTSVALITNTGLVTSISPGQAILYHTSIDGCLNRLTTPLIVDPKPVVSIAKNDICIGEVVNLFSPNGVWTNHTPQTLQLNNALKQVTGLNAGIGKLTFKINSVGCVPDTQYIVVNLQTQISIVDTAICVGGTTTLTPNSGGTWSTTDGNIASITNTGLITGFNPGLVSVVWQNSINGCSSVANEIVEVVQGVQVIITGPASICVGETTTLSPNSGGVWVSNNPLIASVTNDGVVTGLSNGKTTFTYFDTLIQCESTTSEITVGENQILLAEYKMCEGDTIDLLPAIGIWTSSDSSIVKVLPNYKAVGVSSGLIKFKLESSLSNCGTAISDDFTVNPKPIVTLSESEICIGGIVVAAPFGGGTWQSTNNNVAIVNNTGQIIPINVGTTTFCYTRTATGCKSDPSDTLTVIDAINTSLIGTSEFCIGEVRQVTPNTGGAWSSSNPSVATVSNNGIVSSLSLGFATLIYTEQGSLCQGLPILVQVVNTAKTSYDTIGIGDQIMLDTSLSGLWTSSDTAIVKIINNEVAIGLTQGDVVLYFADSTNTVCGDQNIYLHIEDNLNKIIGYTFRDVNNNEQYDFNVDTPLPNIPVTNTTLNTTRYSDQNGYFEIGISQDEALVIDIPYGVWDSTQVTRIARLGNTNAIQVGFYPSPSTVSGMVNMTSQPLRCNTNVKLNSSIFNNGNELLSGRLVVDVSTKSQFVSSTPAPTMQDGSIVAWDFEDLIPGYSFKPDITIYVPNPNLVGPVLSFDGYLVDSSNDTISRRNFTDDILCSYDPNDKRSWPDREGEENLTLRTEHIDYMVRFQNTGNAEAFRVELVDVLPKGLDKMSMMILENSHAMETQMIGDTLKFIFNDINLPDSMSNPEGSQGYVLFSFKSEVGVAENTALKNEAAIYFDVNEPIITNTVINTIVTSILCHEDTTNIAICPGESFSTANNDYTTEGMFSERTYGADGCDTLNHYRISFSDVPSDSIWFDSGIMYVDGVGTSYDWYECEKDSLLFTTILPNAEIMTSGIYGAVIHGVECNVETECVVVVINGLNDLLLDEIKVYPNPASDKLLIQSPYEIESVVIWNVYGQKMDVIINENTLDLNNFPNGAYFARISTKLGDKLVKFMVL